MSPSSSILPDYVAGAVAALRRFGYDPVPSEHCLGHCGGYSGTEAERLADLSGAILNPEVKAILCSRGGYGAVHLLDRLPLDSLPTQPKWLIGFSDISALHAAWSSRGVASIHASMAKHLTLFGDGDAATQALLGILAGGRPCYDAAPHPYNRPGQATGTLAGGNMAVLTGLTATPYDLIARAGILFIEDVGEAVYKIERMLYNLRLNGTLARIKGLVVGRFTDYACPDGNGETMDDMVRRMTSGLDIPIAFGFPCGHVDENMPLIEGDTVTLTVTASGATLRHGARP